MLFRVQGRESTSWYGIINQDQIAYKILPGNGQIAHTGGYKEQVKGWSRNCPPLGISLLQLYGSAFMLERTRKHDLEGNGLPIRT